jgi:hypothetical protein
LIEPAKSNRQRRIATAVGFLSGVLACLDAMRDLNVFWPPDALWQAMRHPQRLEMAGGIALIVVTVVISVAHGGER